MSQHFLEIGTDDVTATRQFFVAVFGWRDKDMPNGALFDTPGGPIGLHGNDPGGGIVPYFAVQDLAASIDLVRQSGGTVEDDVTAEEGFGAFVACRDPRGVRFGLHSV